jgi:CDGSH-type Zn-finger protein
MDKKDLPAIADKKPLVMEVEPGTYHWCSCGLSKSQPFCDGSHAGTGLSPQVVTIDEKKKVAFCLCKQSAKGPFCDGRHKTL